MKAVKAGHKLIRQFSRDYLMISVIPVLALILIGGVSVGLILQYADGLMTTLVVGLTSDAEAQFRYLGQDAIRNKARDVARQLDIYLDAHPDLTMAELQARPDFRAIAQQPVGETGYTAIHEAETDIVRFHATNADLVNQDASYLAEKLPEFWVLFHTPEGLERAGYYGWLEPNGEIRDKYMVVTPVARQVEGVTLMVAATTYIDEFSRPMTAIVTRSETAMAKYRRAVTEVVALGVLAVLLTLGLVLGGAHLLGQRAARIYIYPIRELAGMARQLSQERVLPEADAELMARADEIGVLARGFVQAATHVQELLRTLEQRVADRTAGLERQSMELRTAVEVGQAVSATLDPERLIWQVADVIQKRFGLYHVGIFLMDPSKTWVEYRAGSGVAGRLILDQGLRIEVGSHSMIGRCAARAELRVARDVREEEWFMQDVNLPHTRSEAVLPLIARGQVIGVLDVQSEQVAALDEDTVVVLNIVADQVAVALDNARLYAESEQALERERRGYGEARRGVWERQLGGGAAGYLRDMIGNIQPSGGELQPEMVQAATTRQLVRVDQYTLAAPVMSRDQVLGVARLRKPEGEAGWTDQELVVVQTLIEQLGVALESARLYQDTQKVAARERMTGEISARIRQSLDIDTVLQVAIREIGEAMGLSKVKVRMVPPTESGIGAPDHPPQM